MNNNPAENTYVQKWSRSWRRRLVHAGDSRQGREFNVVLLIRTWLWAMRINSRYLFEVWMAVCLYLINFVAKNDKVKKNDIKYYIYVSCAQLLPLHSGCV